MTIISALKTFILTYPGLNANAEFGVDFLGPDKVAYSITPLAGDKIVEAYIDGGSRRSFPFSIQSVESTADELARIDAIGFYEALGAWFESQTLLGNLPILGAGKTAEEIKTTNWGYQYQQGESATGIYQVQCLLDYEQARP